MLLTIELDSQTVACAMLGIIILFILWVVLSITLSPYRSKFMRWYMPRFSRYYKSADKVYTDLLRVCEDSMNRYPTSRSSAYFKVYDYIINKPEIFRSTEEIRSTNAVTAESFICDEHIACPEFEGFVSFHGKGKCLHKVAVFFSFGSGINLKSIKFFYHEEYGVDSYYRAIKEKEFPPDEPGLAKAKRRKVLV